MSSMRDAEHLVMDGTLKSLHNLFYQLFTVHGLFPDVCHFSLYRNLLTEIDSYCPFLPSSVITSWRSTTLWRKSGVTDLNITKRMMQESPKPRAPKWVRYKTPADSGEVGQLHGHNGLHQSCWEYDLKLLRYLYIT